MPTHPAPWKACLSDFTLYLITDRNNTAGRTLLAVVADALRGGVRAIQLREKDLPDRELYRLAHEVRSLTNEYAARLIINSRVDIALAVDADGVQLGVNSVPISIARRQLGDKRWIIYSAHTVDEALQAEAEGADMVTFSPVFFTPSKASYGPPVGMAALTEAVSRLHIPIIALGGISGTTLGQVRQVKVHGVAVISAIMSAPQPEQATHALLAAFTEP